ncbi:hypothetical protein [Wenyingzhuangia sp. IMCC45574]
MIKVCILLFFLPIFLFSQENTEGCILINYETPKAGNFFLPEKISTRKNITDLKQIENSITSSTLIKGYRYKLNLTSFNEILPIPNIDHFSIPTFSFLNTHLLKSFAPDLNLNGSVNINGITQLMTLKGKLNKYDGNYFFQVSYHVSTNNTNYIPKIVNERHQQGLALIFKVNLERAK